MSNIKNFLHKNTQRIIVLIFYLVCSTDICADKILISLGADCQVAWRLKQFKLRQVAYPFDWLRSYDFDGLLKCIQEKFKFFLAPNCLTLNLCVKNMRYNIEFVHDFPTQGLHSNHVAFENENAGKIIENYLDYLPQVNYKYAPRIKRFLDELNSTNEIFFIRTNIKPHEAQKFIEMMKLNYPCLNYTLVVVHRAKNLKYDWGIPHVINFYAEKNPADVNGWYYDTEWFNIFTELELIVDSSIKYDAYVKSWLPSEMD